MMYTFGIAEPASTPVVIATNQPVVKHNFTVAETLVNMSVYYSRLGRVMG